MAVADEAREATPVSAGFIAGLTLAQIGAYISFVQSCMC